MPHATRAYNTSRGCEYEKCLSVFGCGEEELHTGELDSRSTRSSIQKLKGDIEKLERELNLKETTTKKLSESLGKKIETTLMHENGNKYIEGGIKKWSLLRKHVFIVEKYCKKHFNGSIPPKHKLSDIINVALEDYTPEHKTGQTITRVKTTRANPAKNVLEVQGISFPDINVNECSSSTSHASANLAYRCAPSNKDEEQEQLSMVLKQSMLESNSMTMAPQVVIPNRLQTPYPSNMFHEPNLYYTHLYPHATEFPPPRSPEMCARNPDVNTYGSIRQCTESLGNVAQHQSTINRDESHISSEEEDATNAALQLVSLSSSCNTGILNDQQNCSNNNQ